MLEHHSCSGHLEAFFMSNISYSFSFIRNKSLSREDRVVCVELWPVRQERSRLARFCGRGSHQTEPQHWRETGRRGRKGTTVAAYCLSYALLHPGQSGVNTISERFLLGICTLVLFLGNPTHNQVRFELSKY